MPTERLRLPWRKLYSNFEDHRAITEADFTTMLSHIKLIQKRIHEDDKWKNFYSFLRTVNHVPEDYTEDKLMPK